MKASEMIEAAEQAKSIELTAYTTEELQQWGNQAVPTKNHMFASVEEAAFSMAITSELMRRM